MSFFVAGLGMFAAAVTYGIRDLMSFVACSLRVWLCEKYSASQKN